MTEMFPKMANLWIGSWSFAITTDSRDSERQQCSWSERGSKKHRGEKWEFFETDGGRTGDDGDVDGGWFETSGCTLHLQRAFHKCDFQSLFWNFDWVAQVPQYNWTISDSGEEITVMADRSFTSSHNWLNFHLMIFKILFQLLLNLKKRKICETGSPWMSTCGTPPPVQIMQIWGTLRLRISFPRTHEDENLRWLKQMIYLKFSSS